MQSRKIRLIQSSIDNGRIYFSITDAKFFPSDSLADRFGDGHKGQPVFFLAGTFRIETDIRILSGQRLSPRKTFAPYLKSLLATAGEQLLVFRVNERDYRIEQAHP